MGWLATYLACLGITWHAFTISYLPEIIKILWLCNYIYTSFVPLTTDNLQHVEGNSESW